MYLYLKKLFKKITQIIAQGGKDMAIIVKAICEELKIRKH